MEEELKVLKTLISEKFHEIGEKIERLSNSFGLSHEKLENRVVDLEDKLRGVELQDMQSSVSELKSTTIPDINQRLLGLKQDNEDMRERISRLESTTIPDINQRLLGLKQENEDMRERISRLESTTIPNINQRLLGLKQDNEDMRERISRLESTTIPAINQRLLGFQTQIQIIESSISQLKLVKTNDELSKKMNEWALELGKIVEKVDDQLSSFLSFIVQSGFWNNFIGFLVQYRTGCGKAMTVFILTGCFLLFMAVPFWMYWEMLGHKFKLLDHHHTHFGDFKNQLHAENNNGNAKARAMLMCAEGLLDTSNIKTYYKRRMICMGVFATVVCIVVSVTSHYFFCDNDNKESLVQPLWSLVSSSR